MIETFDELLDLKDRLDDNEIVNIIENLIQSEMDLGNSFELITDFIQHVEKELDGKSTLDNIKRKLQQYESNVSRYAWEAESFTSLIKVFKDHNTKDLKQIINYVYEKTN